MLWFHNGFMAKASPVWVIDLQEATELTTRFCNYASHFQAKVNPRTRDLLLLILCLLIIEGSRLGRFTAERREQKKARREAEIAGIGHNSAAMAESVSLG